MSAKLRTKQIKVSTGSADNDTVTTKGYVDEHSTNAIWSLSSSEVTLTTPTNTIGATTPLKYTSHPTFTIDTEFADKKYVDDTASGGSIDQQNIYYVGKAGDDSNNGKSIEKLFKTVPVAIAAVIGQTPALGNRFIIKVVDGGNYSESLITVPIYTWLDATGAQITAPIILQEGSSFTFRKHTIPAGGNTGITVSGLLAEDTFVSGDYAFTVAANSTYISSSTSAAVHVDVRNIELSGANSKVYDAATNSKIYIRNDNFTETVVSTNDGSADVLIMKLENRNPAFRALMATTQTGTGAGATITLLCDTVGLDGYDLENTYNIGNGQYTAKYDGIYSFKTTNVFLLLLVENNNAVFVFIRRNSGGTAISEQEYFKENIGRIRTGGTTNLIINGCAEFKLNQGDTVEVQLTISGGATNNIQLSPLRTQFSGHLVAQII